MLAVSGQTLDRKRQNVYDLVSDASGFSVSLPRGPPVSAEVDLEDGETNQTRPGLWPKSGSFYADPMLEIPARV